jgi:hypothetical protein
MPLFVLSTVLPFDLTVIEQNKYFFVRIFGFNDYYFGDYGLLQWYISSNILLFFIIILIFSINFMYAYFNIFETYLKFDRNRQSAKLYNLNYFLNQ